MLEKVERKMARVGWDIFLRSSTLIFGPPKVGKTTFISTFPDVLIIETEPGGADYVSGWVIEVSSLKELKQLRDELGKLKPEEWKWRAVALDTLTQISSWLERDIALEFGKSALAGPSTSYGVEYVKHRAEVMAVIKSFQALPCGLLLVAHAREEEGKVTLSLPGRFLAREIMAAVSNVIYLRADDTGKREAVVLPGSTLEAGSRDPVLNRIGKFPPDFRELEVLYKAELEKFLKEGGEVEEEVEEKPDVVAKVGGAELLIDTKEVDDGVSA